MQKITLTSSSSWDSWFKVLKIWLAEIFFDHANHVQLKIYKPPLHFLDLYFYATNHADSGILQSDWLRASFYLTKLKTLKWTFTFLESISACSNYADWPCCSWDTPDLKILIVQEHFGHPTPQLKIYKPSFIVFESTSTCQRSCWYLNSSLIYN